MMYELIDRKIREGDWRDSTYQREDGSTFRVAIPSMVEIDKFDGQPRRRTYNERSEHEMALRLAALPDLPAEEE